VARIREILDLEAGSTIVQTVDAANAMVGLASEGGLLVQTEKLLQTVLA